MPRFVIQQHTKRTSRHFDLMLEQNGKLRTWSMDNILRLRHKKRITLARKLPDHRMIYLTYEGKLSRGRGAVRIWDRGNYRMEQSTPDLFFVTFRGQQLNGTYGFLSHQPPADRWWVLPMVSR